MDDQRIGEIAVRHEDAFINGNGSCLADAIAAAIREALSAQEEELRRVREELRSMLRERREAETASCQGYEAAVARAESAEATAADMQRSLEYANAQWRVMSEAVHARIAERDTAEAELLRLREGMRVKLQAAFDAGNAWDEGGHPDNTEPYPVARRHAVDRLLASPVEEKVT
jgi:hypothetical protein